MNIKLNTGFAILAMVVITVLSLLPGYLSGGGIHAADTVKPEEKPVKTTEPPPFGTGYRARDLETSELTGQSFPAPAGRLMSLGALPARFDWRDPNGDSDISDSKVTPVKSQGSCGSCYAFTTVGNLESKIMIDGGGAYNLSENNAKDCKFRVGDADPCDGGDAFDVINVFTQKGAVLETCDPYVPYDAACKTDCTPVKTVLDWRIINRDSIPDTAVLKQYIQSYGPVFTSLRVSDLTGFTGYNGSYTIPYYATTDNPDHAVVIIGWDDNLTYSGGQGAWIAKNSWGTSWGGTCGAGTERGYFTIAYGSSKIGYDSSYIYNTQDYDVNGGILYYDEAGWYNSLGHSAKPNNLWALAKFVPTSNGVATRVEFWTYTPTSDIDIELYDTFNGSAPGTLLAQKSNQSFAEAGYHSVALDTPLPVTTGNDITVKVHFTSTGAEYRLPADKAGTLQSGSTYISNTGADSSWVDTTLIPNSDGTTGSNLGIRLRTTTVPVANFTANPTSGTAPLTVSFTDQSTGTITSRSWTFGDGGSSTEQNPSHQYTADGSYTVSLTVNGPGGSNTKTQNAYINVTTPAPVAEFTGAPTSGLPPLTVNFTNQSTGTITSHSWSFGDGGTSTETNPSHQYTADGSYNVSLTVTGPGGSNTKTRNGYINVTTPAPVADFSGTPTSGTALLTVNFSDQSTGTITSRSWTFGDGSASTEQNPSHQYTAAGTYTVSLTVTGSGGTDTETKNSYITVTPGALHHVTVTPSQASVAPSANRQFTATGYDQYNNAISGLSFTWSVANGGGGIDGNGLFAAGATRGVYIDTVVAESQGAIIKQGKATVAVGASITVTAILEGAKRPLEGMNVPFTAKLFNTGTALDSGNILTETPVEAFSTTSGHIAITNSDLNSKTNTLWIGGLPTGTYKLTLVTPGCLINLRESVNISEGLTLSMGTLLAGNADDYITPVTSNQTQIFGSDFNMLLNDYLQQSGGEKWNNGRCDFDRNGQVTSIDFSLLVNNYTLTSPQTIS